MEKILANRNPAIRLLNERLYKCGFAQLPSLPETDGTNVTQNGMVFSTRHKESGTEIRFSIELRLWIRKSFLDRNILIAFQYDGTLFVYDHDKLIKYIRETKPCEYLCQECWINPPSYVNAKNPPPKWFKRYIKNAPCAICGDGSVLPPRN